MHTLREAADVLRAAESVDTLAPLAAAFGCSGAPAALDEVTRRGIGLAVESIQARVATGPGALRALMLETRPDAPLRETLSHVASRLASRTPHVLWIVIATQPAGSEVGVAAWTGDRAPPRVGALVADRRHLVDSDAETIRALAAAAGPHDLLVHARWAEILGRESLTRRFYRELECRVRALASSSTVGTEAQRAEVALLYASRLLFLAFLEAKGWLDGDRGFLNRKFDECMASGGGFHRRVLLPLFFGTLNTPIRSRAATARRLGRIPFLNGGLFARTATEKAISKVRFGDAAYGELFGNLFSRYRFTAREETSGWSEAAIDPEMLGRAFESLMVSLHRKESGAFYTPHELVDRIAGAAIERTLRSMLGDFVAARFLTGEPLEVTEYESVGKVLKDLTVLDPACGSGAFLVHVLERIADLLQRAGDQRPITTIRREVLTHSIFGVDRSATAAWLCELRLWLSVVIESGEANPAAVPPLPNLDRNIRVGDSLAGAAFGDAQLATGGAALRRLRERYSRATGVRKQSLARQLEREERRRAIIRMDAELSAIAGRRRELLNEARSRDLFGQRNGRSADRGQRLAILRREAAACRSARRNLVRRGGLPFSYDVHFGDVAERGGFDIVVGNPPWVRVHHIAPAERVQLRDRFSVFRGAGWARGASVAHAGAGFAGQVDLSALFVERSVVLLRPGGTLALLLPLKLWHSLAGGGVRRLLTERTRIVAIEDHSAAHTSFDAVVYPSVVVASRKLGDHDESAADERSPVLLATRFTRTAPAIAWRMAQHTLGFDDSAESPWLLIPREVREAFDLVSHTGVALASAIGRPLLGVKSGCNDAFVVRCVRSDGAVAEVEDVDGKRGCLEASLLRPLLRGEGLRAWNAPAQHEQVIWTHASDGSVLAKLPPRTELWLSPWKRKLQARSDARHRDAWWSLFRTDAAANDRPRVVWADLGLTPRATVLAAGAPIIPLNSCYAVRCDDDTDALALAAIINSPLAAAWLAALAEPARGGYRRFLGWTMGLLPLPANWERARLVLRPLGERAMAGSPPQPHDLLAATLEAYGLRSRDVAPLLAWFDT